MVILLESSKITMQVTNHFRRTQSHIWWLKPVFFQPINTYFLFTGILITSTGIFNKNPTGTGILEKFLVGNGIVTPPPPPSRPSFNVHVVDLQGEEDAMFSYIWRNAE